MAGDWGWPQHAFGNWCVLSGNHCIVGALRVSATLVCHPKHGFTPLKPTGASRPYRWVDYAVSLWEGGSKSRIMSKIGSSHS